MRLCQQTDLYPQGLLLFHNAEFSEKSADLVNVVSQSGGDVVNALSSQAGDDTVP